MKANLSTTGNYRKGQPIFVLGALLLIWMGARFALWQSPFSAAIPIADIVSDPPNLFADEAEPQARKSDQHQWMDGRVAAGRTEADAPFVSSFAPIVARNVQVAKTAAVLEAGKPVTLASHQFLWMAAFSNMPVAPEIATYLSSLQPSPQPVPARPVTTNAVAKQKRWSFDGWVFWRPGSTQVGASGPGSATYGASQAGAVLRYRLAQSDRRNLSAYVRVTKALEGSTEADLAAGLSTRPFVKIPFAMQAEMRVNNRREGVEIRPAGFLITELPPEDLPLGVRLAAYGQAGYVGGEFETFFADGQVKLDREVADFNLAKVRAGAGAWGGAQQGAARVDVGPTASVDIKIGKAPARVSMDYRHRVAGDAEPQSGVAITLSTGF